jgi:hypothetical protein
MPNLYRLNIPLRLAVEADTAEEAREAFEALWSRCMEELPTGAGCFQKEEKRAEIIRDFMFRD